jgi:uncharacterized protein YndB with AHSA1/START domain
VAVENDLSDREIVLERVFDAPRELVWRAYTEVEHLVHWWGPDGFTTTYHEFDLRPGGIAKFIMHGPDGKDWPNKMWFREVVKPERLVYGHGDFERPWFDVTATFEARGKQTLFVARMLFATAAECAAKKQFGAVEGGRQSHNRLAQYLREMS